MCLLSAVNYKYRITVNLDILCTIWNEICSQFRFSMLYIHGKSNLQYTHSISCLSAHPVITLNVHWLY